MARTTADEANTLEAALTAAGYEPDEAATYGYWDIFERNGLAAALAALEKTAMTDTLRTPGEIDADFADYTDNELRRVIERGGALASEPWHKLTREQQQAQRAQNMLIGRQQARQTAADAQVLELRAAANRAAFSAARGTPESRAEKLAQLGNDAGL